MPEGIGYGKTVPSKEKIKSYTNKGSNFGAMLHSKSKKKGSKKGY